MTYYPIYIYIYVRPSFWCISHIYLDLLAAVLDICHLEKAQRLFSASKTHRAWLSPSWRVWQECQCLKYFSSGPYCHWHHWHWTVVMLYVWTLWSPVYTLYHALYIRCMACQLETLFLQHSLPAHLCFSGGGPSFHRHSWAAKGCTLKTATFST